MKITLKDQKRTGVHKHMKFEGGAIRTDTRMTIPAREALERVSIVRDLRCANEPQFPGEIPNPDMWIEVDLTPCPKCGAALVRYEAGYVPGYRVCAGKAHHHFIAVGSRAFLNRV